MDMEQTVQTKTSIFQLQRKTLSDVCRTMKDDIVQHLLPHQSVEVPVTI